MKRNQAPKRSRKLALEIHPLTSERWADLETLFGPRGACGGCWCMSWRLKRADFVKGKGQPNRDAFKHLVDSGCEPGLLAYHDGKPVAWIAVAPRADYAVLERSRVLKPLDEKPVWSVSCFFIAKAFRKKGVSVALLKAAADFVSMKGGVLIEGYPVEPKMKNMPDVFAWTGLPSAFLQAGFTEAARRSPTRPIMRLNVGRKTKRVIRERK